MDKENIIDDEIVTLQNALIEYEGDPDLLKTCIDSVCPLFLVLSVSYTSASIRLIPRLYRTFLSKFIKH